MKISFMKDTSIAIAALQLALYRLKQNKTREREI